MDTMTLRVFQREVVKQCRFALASVGLLNDANARLSQTTDWTERDVVTNQLWFSLQGFLISAANISKLMWGTKSGSAETWARRKKDRLQLRATLGVVDNSILKLSPEFRNHFEHLDERIEEWVDTSTHHNLVEDLIGSTSMISGLDPGDFMRSYDPQTHRLCFRGEVFEIVPVVDAISSLLPKAQAEADKPHWDWDNPGQAATAAGGGQ